jgi:excisionase family DNA binding protein
MTQQHLERFEEASADALRRHGADLGGKATCSVPEAGAILGIGRGLAYQAVRDGTIPALRIGRRWVVPVGALTAMLSAAGAEVK